MADLTVAKTILEQMGGNKIIAMTGAYNILGDANSLSFKFKGSRKANYIKITLNSLDLYDVYFCRIRSFEKKDEAEFNGLYYDMLNDVFEKHTGLATRL